MIYTGLGSECPPAPRVVVHMLPFQEGVLGLGIGSGLGLQLQLRVAVTVTARARARFRVMARARWFTGCPFKRIGSG